MQAEYCIFFFLLSRLKFRQLPDRELSYIDSRRTLHLKRARIRLRRAYFFFVHTYNTWDPVYGSENISIYNFILKKQCERKGEKVALEKAAVVRELTTR
jgi:hypothetical protein